MYYHSYWRCVGDCKAAASFKLAAEKGDTLAQCFYGICLYRGRGTHLDKEGARAQFKAAAENGDSLWQFCYGLLLFEESECHLEPESPGWECLQKAARNGCNEAAVIIGLQEFADNNTFENCYFKRALEQQDLCALYNYGISLLVDDSTYQERSVFQKMVDCFQSVAKQHGDGSEYNYREFFKKRMGYDCGHRWQIVRLECQDGCPESQFVYGCYLYMQGKTTEAFDYFTLAATKKHHEALFACAVCRLHHDPMSYPNPEIKECFEQAAQAGVLEAQYHYGNLLVTSSEMKDMKHGAELLSMAAKEILLRRQCKCVKIVSRGQPCTFCYSPIPRQLTKPATDNYIWDHIGENWPKMAWSFDEIRKHNRVPEMRASQRGLCASNIAKK